MRAKPAVTHANEEEAGGARERREPTGNAVKHRLPKGRSCSEPEAQDPNGLPGKEIESSGLLEWNLKMRKMDDPIVDQIAQAELSEQPDGATGDQDSSPAKARCSRQNQWSEEQECDVHG
jgi:hypothetical protein